MAAPQLRPGTLADGGNQLRLPEPGSSKPGGAPASERELLSRRGPVPRAWGNERRASPHRATPRPQSGGSREMGPAPGSLAARVAVEASFPWSQMLQNPSVPTEKISEEY